MKFQKQVQFSKHIKIQGQLKEFNFLKLNKNDFPTYTVDVSDDRGRRFIFLFMQDGKDWKITGDDLPNWVLDAKEMLRQEVELSLADSLS